MGLKLSIVTLFTDRETSFIFERTMEASSSLGGSDLGLALGDISLSLFLETDGARLPGLTDRGLDFNASTSLSSGS